MEQTVLPDLILYTKENYQTLMSESMEKKFSHITSLLTNDAQSYVSNVITEVVALIAGKEAWAVTINEKEYGNALICSPYATYVKYPLDEIQKFDKLWVKALLLVHSYVMGLLFRISKINRAIQVNNNLNSLLKHPSGFAERLPQLTKLLVKKYPKHAVTFYRINNVIDKAFFSVLQENGYHVFPDRPAHVFFPDFPYMKRSHTRRDMSLLRNSPYKIVPHQELTDADADRICTLYQMLFVDKHSKFNPIYTKKYFRQAIQQRWHHYTALRSSDGSIDGFISWFYSESIMICGPLGYDTRVDRKIGLYRQLVAICLKHASENHVIFNMGGGSDEFKLKRGSTQTLEYTAVYCRHLPFYRQLPWRVLSWACNKLLKKILNSTSRL